MLTGPRAAWSPRTVTRAAAPSQVPEPPLEQTVIAEQIAAALRATLDAADLPQPERLEVVPTAQREHGDLQSNVALTLKKAVGSPPRDIADRIVAALEAASPPHVERIEVAGPGFINFFLAPTWLHEVLREVVAAGEVYGRGDSYAGLRVNLEFVSVNPTGPLHAGGGRWVAVGDAIANLLAAQGAVVHREYYLNDAGNQLDTFGASLFARYNGEQPPEDGYQGAYMIDMAERMRAELGDAVTEPEAREWGLHDAVAQLQDDLGRIGVHFDTWFSERTLHEMGKVATVLARLQEGGFTYEREGATWLRSEDLGDQRDRVLVRSDGSTTYLCNDFAYHLDKIERGWEHLIDIWGSDHHGQVKSLQVGMRTLGVGTAEDPEPEIILGQFVSLVRNGETVKLSKRTGTIISLADILDEVDPDVARLTFLLQGIDTTQTFDLDLVTSQSRENPVYYVQYAHARVRVDRAEGRGARRDPWRPRGHGSLAARARARARPPAHARRVPRGAAPRGSPRARRIGSPPGCGTSRRGFTASTGIAGSSPMMRRSPRPASGSPNRVASASRTHSGSSGSAPPR